MAFACRGSDFDFSTLHVSAASTRARGQHRLLGRTSFRSPLRRLARSRRSPAATLRLSFTVVARLRSTTPMASASRTCTARSTRCCGVAGSAPRYALPSPALSLRACPSAPRLVRWPLSSPRLGAAAPSGRRRTCSGALSPPSVLCRSARAPTTALASTPARPSAATSGCRGSSGMGTLRRVSPRGPARRAWRRLCVCRVLHVLFVCLRFWSGCLGLLWCFSPLFPPLSLLG